MNTETLIFDGSKADISGFGMVNVTTKAGSDILQMAQLKVKYLYHQFKHALGKE